MPSATPSVKSRRMTLGGIPSSNILPPSSARKTTNAATPLANKSNSNNVTNRRKSIAGLKTNNESEQPIPNRSRVPKARQSMLPRVNTAPPPSPSPSVLSSTAASRRRSVGFAPSVTEASTKTKTTQPPRPRKSLSGASPARGGRPSLGGGTSHTSTTAAPPLPPTTKQDSRPIHDKAFQQKAIKSVVSYLQDHRYPYPVSTKTLQNPSSKDFVHIFTFMLQQIDPSFGTTTSNKTSKSSTTGSNIKLEEEIVMCFKFLGYPFTLSKTAIVAGGSSHGWPSLLAALLWLVELDQPLVEQQSHEIQYLHDSNAFTTAVTSSPSTTTNAVQLAECSDKAFFQYMLEAYQGFLFDDEGHRQQMETKLMEHYELGDQLLEQLIEQQTDWNTALVEQMEAQQQELALAESLAQKREEHVMNLEQYRDLIHKLELHQQALTSKVEESTKELENVQQQIQQSQRDIQATQQVVQSQTMTVQDELKLQSHLKELMEALERLEQHKFVLLEELQHDEQTKSQVQEKCHQLLVKFQSDLTELEDKIPPELRAPAKIVEKWKTLTIHDLVSDPSIVTQIETLRDKGNDWFDQRTKSLQDKHQDLLDTLEQLQQRLQELLSQQQYWNDKMTKLQGVLETSQQTLLAKLAIRQRDIDAMEVKVAKLQDVAYEAQVAAYERQCNELAAMQATYVQHHVERSQQIEREINEAIELLLQHDAYVQDRIQHVDEYLQHQLMQAKHLSLQSSSSSASPQQEEQGPA